MKNLFCAAIAAFFSFSVLYAADGLKVGDAVDNFSLKNVDGNNISLLDHTPDSKGYILIFTCNHCPYSIAYEDRILALNKKFANMGYPVVAVNPNDPEIAPDDSFENMIERSKDKGFTFPYLYDETQQIAKKFGATRTPHVFLLKKIDGQLRVAYIGAIDDDYSDESAAKNKYVENAIAALESGNKPSPEITKAIGCSIKWKK